MAYTTIKDNVIILNKESWKGIKRYANYKFDGSDDLFEACWRQYRGYLTGGIDDPKDMRDIMEWLDQIAAEKVNNPRSRFYIYG
jgi:hypothetical protein